VRLIDFLKSRQITLYMTSLASDGDGDVAERSSANISSIVDTWILLRNDETNGARIRTLSVLKSRGMAHSSATHRFAITPQGVALQSAPTLKSLS
jgi:circadian clock protein KaiC